MPFTGLAKLPIILLYSMLDNIFRNLYVLSSKKEMENRYRHSQQTVRTSPKYIKIYIISLLTSTE